MHNILFNSYVPLHVSGTFAPILRRTSVSTTSGSTSVSFGDRAVGRLVRDCSEQSLTNLPTARSPKETDIEPDVVDMQGSS